MRRARTTVRARGTFTARERRGRAQFTGRLWTARGARRKKNEWSPREAPPPTAKSDGRAIRQFGGRGAMAQPKTTLYVGASARAPPEPARGSPIAIDRTTRRGDPTGRSLLPPSRPSSASPSRRTTDPALPPFPSRPRRARRASHRGGAPRRVRALRRPEGREHPARPPDAEEPGVRLRHLRGKVRAERPRFPLQPPRTVILRLARPSFLRSRARSTDLSIDRHPPRSKRNPRDRAFSDLTSAPDARRAFVSQGGRRGGHVQHAQRRTLRARASV